jgi:hypothetical protein
MIFRKERLKERKLINSFMREKNCSVEELYDIITSGDIHYSSNFKTQLRKMILEEKAEDYKKNLTYIMVKNQRLPVVFCTESKGRWIFYCPFCQRIHYHSPHSGHRHAHCDADSFFRPDGYYLMLEANK